LGPRKREVDIRDVAKLAQVSIATVSRALNKVPTVDEALAKRVWKAAKDLNYFPNTQARALVSGRSRIFGLLVSDITNPFFPELMKGFEEIAVANGYEILIGSTNYEPERMVTCIRRMLERNVDGVAAMTFGIETPLLDELTSRDIPLVLVDAGPATPLSSALIIDYAGGIRQGVQHLAALGHRTIGFISGPLKQKSAELRKTAFLESLREIGITPQSEWLLEGDHTLEGGVQAMDQLLALPSLPTGIMCSNDMTAIGVLRSLARAGRRVPEDLSVIGFDDIHLAEFVYPPLTTVQMSRIELAHAAFKALRFHVEQPFQRPSPRSLSITTKLVVRQSTGFPRGTLLPNGRPGGHEATKKKTKALGKARATAVTSK
jgi:DNA-binding LacI/PurR family transcriptional regulator